MEDATVKLKAASASDIYVAAHEQKQYWVVLAPFAFAAAGLEVAPGQPTHFLPVFTSREEADTWNRPGYPVIRLGSPSETAEFWRRAQAVEEARDAYRRHTHHDSVDDPRD